MSKDISQELKISNLVSSNETEDDLKPKFMTRLLSQKASLNETVVFNSEFYSQTKILKINWYHNGMLIESKRYQSKFYVKNENNKTALFIYNVNFEDEGYYELRIENSYGYSMIGTNLEVKKGKLKLIKKK